MKKTTALIILDGFGIGEDNKSNAIFKANMPVMDKLLKTCSNTKLEASGLAVGLPQGQMGNSEVGHTNIGAGRIVYQSLTRITKSIEDGDFFQNEALLNACDNVKKYNSSLHLMGLLSNGGVHSHINHLFALLEMCKKNDISNVFIHIFADGRDVPPSSAINFVKELQQKTQEIGIGKIATVCGRYYAMDRDNRWDRVKQAYEAMVCCKGKKAMTAVEAVEQSYCCDITDEFIIPTVIDGGKAIEDNDSVIFYNFRPDRAREITKALTQNDFNGFEREKVPNNLKYVCMTEYDSEIKDVEIAFKPISLNNTLGEVLALNQKTQLRIAETEKYAHVTFFFNGGREEPYENEKRELIASPKVATYDLKPEMSAYEVAEKACEHIESGNFDVVILNFANCDMVGHTGNFNAAVKACEAVDECLGKVLKSIEKVGGKALITADHGNADFMFDENGEPFTAHTTNPVPFILFGDNRKLADKGVLADIAPTILDLISLPKPIDMTGISLLIY